MVQIVVRMPKSSGGVGEWGIIELQGELETRRPVPLSGAPIGDLHFTEEHAILIVGHHILTGSVVDMEKPYAVLARSGGNHGHPVAMDTEHSVMETDQQETTVQYKVVALVKKKIIFNKRPKPIIATVPQKL